MITLENIARSFGDKKVLHDLSFTIGDGRMTGFVGANGSGKRQSSGSAGRPGRWL